jgi:hypothetical protein
LSIVEQMNIDCVCQMYNIFKYATGGLAAALLVSNVAWYVAWDWQKDRVVAEQRSHEKTKQNYKDAQAEATIKAYEAKVKEDEDNAKKAKKADEAYSALLSKYNASILRYEASQRAASTINLSSTSTTSDGDYQSSDSTSISITISDAQICAENTARLMAAHEWGKTYNK